MPVVTFERALQTFVAGRCAMQAVPIVEATRRPKRSPSQARRRGLKWRE
jgi:hypothetical protein